MKLDKEKSEAKETDPLKGGTETILLVDDEKSIRLGSEQILNRFGYTVLLAPDGEKALEIYKNEKDRIDLVILDLLMPGMDGKRCLKHLIQVNPQAKVIIASGYIPDGRTVNVLESLAKRLISKPFNIKQLLKVVREVLDRN